MPPEVDDIETTIDTREKRIPRAYFWAALSVPLRFAPAPMHSAVLAAALSHALKPRINRGELEFLAGRTVAIEVLDLPVTYRFGFDGSRFFASRAAPDVSFAATAHDLLTLAARREDADTLFFQRRLRVTGDTELGVHVKNLLDGVELAALPASVRLVPSAALDLYRRLFV